MSPTGTLARCVSGELLGEELNMCHKNRERNGNAEEHYSVFLPLRRDATVNLITRGMNKLAWPDNIGSHAVVL
jgi:hypothetical protein